MSPHLRNLLEDAADDGGRPVRFDLAAVKAAGRRATWRQRAIIGGGGLSAAAVITTIALVLAPGGTSPFGPSDGGPGIDEPPPGGPQAQELAPLIAALAEKGYEIDYSRGSGTSGSASAGGDGPATSVVAAKLSIGNGDQIGAAFVAEFTDLALLGDGSWDPFDETATNPQCAIAPVGSGLEVDAGAEFAWTSCDMHVDGTREGADLWFATGGSPEGEVVGVTMVRSDGTGISVSLSTEPYDRTITEDDRPGLDELPLTHLELVDVLSGLDQIAPLFPGSPPTDLPPGSDACAEPAPPGTACETAGSDEIEIEPLIDALAALGIEVSETGGYGGGDADGGASTVVKLLLTDDAGRVGSASVGVYSDLAAAQQLGGGEETGAGESANWCAVSPVEVGRYQWTFADDPSTVCEGIESSVAGDLLVFVHDEPDAGAIGATLILADGSVVSVSVSQAVPTTISALPTPLAEVPLDQAGIIDVLQRLAAAK